MYTAYVLYNVQISSKINVYTVYCTVHIVVGSHFIREWKFAFFTCVFLKFLSFLYFMAKHTYTHGKKMFNVFAICASPISPSRHWTVFQFHIHILVCLHRRPHFRGNIRNNFFFLFSSLLFWTIAWKTYENATTRWLSSALVCFWPFYILPLMKDNQKVYILIFTH